MHASRRLLMRSRVATQFLLFRSPPGQGRCVQPETGVPIARDGDLISSCQSFSPFKIHLRTFAKAKKAKGNDDDSAPYVDVYPTVKENAINQMEASLDALTRELSKLRTGRVSAGMLDHVTVVDNNGMRSPLTHVAAVTVIDNDKLRVTPFDSSIVKCVEHGVRSSPLKLNPVVDGDIISVPVPKPTKEYIETMLKVVGKAAETAKLSIRRARQTAMDAVKKSSGNVSKDDIKRREKEIDDLTKKFVKTVDDNCKAKEKEMIPG
ncbi:hypothetical protein KP509_03G014600 [Ceratopteris richardii]|uniref:Ribosome-recycling factor, chloroplastic n=1 Tax=Ceratopteris richardii TaxID=49495 RepID=A0A8T2V1P0_CERRI|nr:hypothetical protein KP509_03G014600 [Ceratopteris richardii]